MSNSSVNRLDLPALKGEKSDDSAPVGFRVDLVEHVTVQLTVALGTAEMPIGKLFALSTGEVVELDRDVDAPLDICLHGRVVARGQMVAVGDRFGVQISEVCSDSK